MQGLAGDWRRTVPSLCGLAFALLPALLAAQTVYRSVGPDGRVSFSDRPLTPEARASATGRAPSSLTPAALAGLPYELRQLTQKYPVTLYTTEGCAPCDSARALLRARGIPYAERTVNTPQDGEALKTLSGDMGLPLLTIGPQQLRGFAEPDWQQYLSAAGYPPQSQLPPGYRAPAPAPLAPPRPVESLPSPIDNTPPPLPVGPTGSGNPAGIAF